MHQYLMNEGSCCCCCCFRRKVKELKVSIYTILIIHICPYQFLLSQSGINLTEEQQGLSKVAIH